MIKGTIIDETKFCSPFRIILAGSSGSGITRFAGNLLEKKDIFEENPESVVYYYPCFLEEAPVYWHDTLDIPVSYHIGLPTKEELIKLPERSCVVIDDSFEEAINSSAIDHLFRVISGKKNISVMIMTQNNFSKGRYGREIRNSCNFSVLFRNCCDTKINSNVTRMAGLEKAFKNACLDSAGVKYPYYFLDQSQQGQLSQYRLYTDIFSSFKVVFSVDGMKGYVIGATDFELFFSIYSNGKYFTANENKKSPVKSSEKPVDPVEFEFTDSESESETCTERKPEPSSKPCTTNFKRNFKINPEWRERIKQKRALRRRLK